MRQTCAIVSEIGMNPNEPEMIRISIQTAASFLSESVLAHQMEDVI